jgi:hypothetical protein
MPLPIIWNSSEDRLLKFSIKKYGKNNWYKIFFNLYTKNKPQIKSRWKGWGQSIIQKQVWKQLEDILLFNSIRPCISNHFSQKYYCPDRTLWQRFFRSKIIVSLDQFKQKKKKQNQFLNLNRDFVTENPLKIPIPESIKIQMLNNRYVVQKNVNFKRLLPELYCSTYKDKKTSVPLSFKKPRVGTPVLKKLYYRRVVEQNLSQKVKKENEK